METEFSKELRHHIARFFEGKGYRVRQIEFLGSLREEKFLDENLTLRIKAVNKDDRLAHGLPEKYDL